MEWQRLATLRSSWLIAALCLASSGGLGLATALYGRHAVTLDLAGSVVNPGQPEPTAILLGVLGVLAWGHDYRYRTLGPLLTVLPHRSELAAARLLVVSGFVTVVAVAGVALAWVAGLLATGGQLAQFSTRPAIDRMMLGSVLLGLGCAWFGLALGALLRSLPAAIAVFFLVPAVLEPLGGTLLGTLPGGVDRWLPFHAIGQLTSLTPAPADPSPAVGAAVFLGLMLTLIGFAVLAFRSRDA
jgi:ABC-2 type transport system permease protein